MISNASRRGTPPPSVQNPFVTSSTSYTSNSDHHHAHQHNHYNNNNSSGMDDSEEEEAPTCPLCLEDMDTNDCRFKPCPCGYQVNISFTCIDLSYQIRSVASAGIVSVRREMKNVQPVDAFTRTRTLNFSLKLKSWKYPLQKRKRALPNQETKRKLLVSPPRHPHQLCHHHRMCPFLRECCLRGDTWLTLESFKRI